MRSASRGCRTATTGWACTSPTSRTTSSEGSALDLEGYDRATSVYFPDRAVHMFPSELATGICSLNPRVDRLVQSCLMEVDRERVGRPARIPRRRHQHRRAHDLHGRQRDSHRAPLRARSSEVPRSRAEVRADGRAVPGPQRPPEAARLDRFRPARSRGGARTTRAAWSRSSRRSGTSRTS